MTVHANNLDVGVVAVVTAAVYGVAVAVAVVIGTIYCYDRWPRSSIWHTLPASNRLQTTLGAWTTRIKS